MFNGAGVFVGHLSPFVIFAALGTETGAVSSLSFPKVEAQTE